MGKISGMMTIVCYDCPVNCQIKTTPDSPIAQAILSKKLTCCPGNSEDKRAKTIIDKEETRKNRG